MPDNDSNPTATSLGYTLLCLLLQKPSSGYDLCQIFETSPMAHYSSSPGAIYPALKRLELKGLLTADTENAGSLRPRRVYRTTVAGNETLRAWITEPLNRDDMVKRMDDVMMRFAFLGHVAGNNATRQFLSQLAVESDTYADELDGYHRKLLDLEPPHGRLALETGIEYHRNIARWARRTLESFNDN